LICDRCKKEETGENEYRIKDAGWKEITISQGQYSSGRNLKDYLLCPDCSSQLGIFDKAAKPTATECHTLADRLLECIIEIVTEQAQA
jgi:hypothetical protein